jgi:hypothetical protein
MICSGCGVEDPPAGTVGSKPALLKDLRAIQPR